MSVQSRYKHWGFGGELYRKTCITSVPPVHPLPPTPFPYGDPRRVLRFELVLCPLEQVLHIPGARFADCPLFLEVLHDLEVSLVGEGFAHGPYQLTLR